MKLNTRTRWRCRCGRSSVALMTHTANTIQYFWLHCDFCGRQSEWRLLLEDALAAWPTVEEAPAPDAEAGGDGVKRCEVEDGDAWASCENYKRPAASSFEWTCKHAVHYKPLDADSFWACEREEGEEEVKEEEKTTKAPPAPDAPELLPCPFCGNTRPQMNKRKASDEWDEWWVKCYDCNCEVDQAGTYSPEVAADAWNRRAPVPSPAPESGTTLHTEFEVGGEAWRIYRPYIETTCTCCNGAGHMTGCDGKRYECGNCEVSGRTERQSPTFEVDEKPYSIYAVAVRRGRKDEEMISLARSAERYRDDEAVEVGGVQVFHKTREAAQAACDALNAKTKEEDDGN